MDLPNDKAMGNLGYARTDLDFYPTPPECTRALLPFLQLHVPANERVWECGCGTGIMSEVLLEAYPDVLSTDIQDYGYEKMLPGRYDFLEQTQAFGSFAIVTNPPFGDEAEKFIRKALELTKPVQGVVAMLLRHEYDCSKGRNDLFNPLHPKYDAPFARKVTFTWRPRWIPGSTGAPRHNYAWFIWDWQSNHPPFLSYTGRPK